MALSGATGAATFDQTAGELLDLSNELALIIRADNTAFLSKLAMGPAATETTHSWMEDSLNSNTATESGTGINNSATTMDVLAGEGVKFKAGTLFKDNTAGKTEVIQVTAVSTDTLTIVRGYGSTTGEAHAASFPILIIAHTKQENDETVTDESKVRTKVSNFTQIFKREVQVGYTLQAVNQAGVANEYAMQTVHRMKEIERELDSTLVNGIKSASSGSDSVYRSMGGIIEFASQATGNTNSTSEAISPNGVSASVKQIWDDGGAPDFILVSGNVVDRFTSDL